ncbi:hypothetical protein CDIK_3126 [Cucumispora dikerogammari]|nr:hypothetical protein CDIK_3126 [Cucumispora dikerogammari]
MPTAYLNIFNYKNISIYQLPLRPLSEPEITEFYLFSFSALEVFLFNCEPDYFIELEKYGNLRSSMLLTPSGLKLILVHKNISKRGVRRILYKIHSVIKHMVVNPIKYGFVNDYLYEAAHNMIERVACSALKDEMASF